MHITIYSKPSCPQCAATKRAFDRLGAPTPSSTSPPTRLHSPHCRKPVSARRRSCSWTRTSGPATAPTGFAMSHADCRPSPQRAACSHERRRLLLVGVAQHRTIRRTLRFPLVRRQRVPHTAAAQCGAAQRARTVHHHRAHLWRRRCAQSGAPASQALPQRPREPRVDPRGDRLRQHELREAYAAAGPIISRKCHVPLMYRFELMGTREDVHAVREGVRRFFIQSPTDRKTLQ